MDFELKMEERPVVLLVGLCTKEDDNFENSMLELENLAKACNKRVAGQIIQRMEYPNKALYIGPGKVDEVCAFCEENGIQEIIFDKDLSSAQLRNLQKDLSLPILDRSLLILEIFALRARSKEARLQVEVARLQYMLPRLVGLHSELGRQGGASGSLSNKGSGEKKIELDRRRIEHRISQLRRELKDVEKNRETQRKRRLSSEILQVSLVGYTNAGKSTIMNRLIDRSNNKEEKKVFEKNMLFATLDTNVRLMDFNDKMPFYLTDTVGFVQHLPHGLVEAFHSTLEEVKYADLLVQVVDISDENYKEQMETTMETLKEIGAANIPMLTVFNKADESMLEYPYENGETIRISALAPECISLLIKFIQKNLYKKQQEVTLLFPYINGKDLSYFIENANIINQEFKEEGVLVSGYCSDIIYEKMKSFIYRGKFE